MSYTNYKKISYILSEKPGLSGQMAFEFLDQLVSPNDVLRFTLNSNRIHAKTIDLLIQMYNDIIILPSMTHEKTIIIKDFIMNDKLRELLCELGMFPNFLKISKISSNLTAEPMDYSWAIEFCDEILTFIYADKLIDETKIIMIEQSLLDKKLLYERKETKRLN